MSHGQGAVNNLDKHSGTAVPMEYHVVKRFIAALITATCMLGASAANVPPTVAMTSPAANANFVALAEIVLSAQAADSDGSVAKVEFYNGASRIGTVTAAPFKLNWFNVAAGDYTITAKAFDDQGITAVSSPLAVSVKANTPPSVTLSAPSANAVLVAPVHLDIKAVASDTDGTVKRVTFYRDNTPISYSDTAPYGVTWNSAPAGIYSITARALDDKGAVTISLPVAVEIKENALPTVTMTSPASGTSFAAPGTVSLTASAADADGTVVSVAYYRGGTYLGSASAPPFLHTWTNAPIGEYSITARARDNKGGLTDSNPVLVSVKANMAPTVSMVAPATNTTYTGPADMLLKASAADSDGTIAKVVFYHDGVLMGTVTSAPFEFAAPNQPVGNYSIVAHAVDDKGATTVSAPVAVTVKQNVAPTVAITAPANNAAFYPGALTLTASAADSDGSVAQVAFYHGTVLIGTATSAPFSVAWPDLTPGTYTIHAKATDDKGWVGTSAAVTVTIQAAPVPVVTIIPPASGAGYVAPATITLTANASVAGDSINKVEYFSAGNLIGTANSPPYSITLNNIPAGSYEVFAKATGNFGGTATSSVHSLVVTENSAPTVVLQVSPVTATAPAVVTLTATATDQEGTITKVDFFNGDTLLGTVTQAPFVFTWSDIAAGTYSVSAKATDNAGATTTSTVQTLTVTAPAIPGGSQIFYVYNDQISAAREITNAAGTTVWKADPEPFGANLPNENPVGQGVFTYNQRFPGQYFDKETGLHYNYYRDYDPSTGRYVQSDPIGLNGGINTYTYVGGNPVAYTDFYGLAPGDPYLTEAQAAVAAIRDVFPLTAASGNEWGGRVYVMPNGKFSYTVPSEGNSKNMGKVPSLNCPNNGKSLGMYHTHPNVKPHANGTGDPNIVSGGDQTWGDLEGAIFVGAPNGDVLKYTANGTPYGGKVTIIGKIR